MTHPLEDTEMKEKLAISHTIEQPKMAKDTAIFADASSQIEFSETPISDSKPLVPHFEF